jgi:hypothetical protein
VHFRHDFHVAAGMLGLPWQMEVTADARYRIAVNGIWLGDGPFRAWPEHYLHDLRRIEKHLREGVNTIDVFVTHYGVGNFQYIPASPGLLCALSCDGQEVLVSDGSWLARMAGEAVANVPRFGCQLGFEETWDARLCGGGDWQPVNEVRRQEDDDHRDLRASATPFLTRIPKTFGHPLHACAVRVFDHEFALRRDECLSPDFGAADIVALGGVFRTVLECVQKTTIEWRLNFGFEQLVIDGRKLEWESASWVDGIRVARCELDGGTHEISIAVCSDGSNINDILLGCYADHPLAFRSPLGDPAMPWAVVVCGFDPAEVDRRVAGPASAADGWRSLSVHELARPSASFAIRNARKMQDLEFPAAGRDGHVPAAEEATCLLFDLGKIHVGYFDMVVEAAAGTVIEGHAVEYIDQPGQPDQWVQQTANKLNGFRVICKDGRTVWTGRERRGMRYLQLVIRAPHGPVRIERLQLLESTYPVCEPVGFSCDDERLNAMHRVAAHTLKLCMEDTFTDCPTYEQVTWIGDARNEALFNYFSFGAEDIVRRTLEIGAQSLERSELVCAFGPMDVPMELPAWSFLWGVAVWEYYWYRGDLDFLRSVYPAVKLNLERSLARIDANGLFRGRGMFDWTPIDHDKPYVTHNQMFLCGALESAARCAEVLDLPIEAAAWRLSRSELAAQINRQLWSEQRNAYVDSMDDDRTLSEKTCQHTSALALLYDLAPEGRKEAALKNLTSPPAQMTGVGSPFAMFFFLEAYVKLGMPEKAMDIIRGYWGTMCDHGATTFWEMVEEDWLQGRSRKPTRSHCHGWSSAPLEFFGRVILGVSPRKPGFAEVDVRPVPCGLKRASGAVPTPLGPLHVSWEIDSEGRMKLDVAAPPEMTVWQPTQEIR